MRKDCNDAVIHCDLSLNDCRRSIFFSLMAMITFSVASFHCKAIHADGVHNDSENGHENGDYVVHASFGYWTYLHQETRKCEGAFTLGGEHP
jgi:hypothetical protein